MPDWHTLPGRQTPYVHWFNTMESGQLAQSGLKNAPPLYQTRPRGQSKIKDAASGQDTTADPYFTGEISNRYFDSNLTVPLPIGAHATRDVQARPSIDETVLLRQRIRDIPKDAVITGIIDNGIALGNARFRDAPAANGALQSRILASWQQAGVWAKGFSNIAFGRELFQKDIEALFAEHQTNGWLDEDTFNRAAGLSEPHRRNAQRDLEFNAAHGTHVMDLAAGLDVTDTPAEILARRPIIAVNLPDRFSHGSAGNFLEYLAVYAIDRIVDLADLIWDEQHGAGTAPGAFPIVINLSYGMQAGPKDASMIFEAYCSEIIQRRADEGKPPLRIMLPAGNDNLMRCHARALLGQEKEGEAQREKLGLSWRVMPADQTSNFIEIHATPVYNALNGAVGDSGNTRMQLTIHPPGHDAVRLSGKPGAYIDLWGFARLYCDALPEAGNPLRNRIRFILCTLPSMDLTDDTRTAPAGLWRLTLHYDGLVTDVSVFVQSDQALVAGSANAKRSYFDDPSYHRFANDGGLADTYSHPEAHHLDHWGQRGPIQRKGTLNAIASNTAGSVIGGFRLKDGAPAAYSSTTRAESLLAEETKGRKLISALFPADDGCLHQGLMASGVRSGSTAFIQGTSMSTALSTRCIVEAMLQNPDNGTEAWLKDSAKAFEASLPRPDGIAKNWVPYRDFMRLKTGGGRVPADMPRRVERMGKG